MLQNDPYLPFPTPSDITDRVGKAPEQAVWVESQLHLSSCGACNNLT